MKAGVSSITVHQYLSRNVAKGTIWSERIELVEALLEHSSCTAVLITDPWSPSCAGDRRNIDEKRNGIWGGGILKAVFIYHIG